MPNASTLQTEHPLYRMWTHAKDRKRDERSRLCEAWSQSFSAFAQDILQSIGMPPTDRGVVVLAHQDFLKPLGPGNVAWMSRMAYNVHVKRENSRLLMKEIGQPIPDHKPPDFLVRPTMSFSMREKHGFVRPSSEDSPLSRRARYVKENATRYEYLGERKSIPELAKVLGVSCSTLHVYLVQKGLSVEEALPSIRANQEKKKKS